MESGKDRQPALNENEKTQENEVIKNIKSVKREATRNTGIRQRETVAHSGSGGPRPIRSMPSTVSHLCMSGTAITGSIVPTNTKRNAAGFRNWLLKYAAAHRGSTLARRARLGDA